jgi:hypothetical protein
VNGVCDRIACENDAALMPIITVEAESGEGGAAIIGVTVEVCLDHADMSVEDFLDAQDGEAWQAVLATFREHRKQPPSRESATLNWVPIPFAKERQHPGYDA